MCHFICTWCFKGCIWLVELWIMKNQIFVINQKSPFSIWWFPWTVLQYACCMICHVFWQNLLLLCLCYDVMWPCAMLCWLPGCVIRWHHSWDGIIHEMTSFMWWHLSWDDIIHEMTSVMCYISSVDCNIQPQPSSCCDQHVMCFFFCYNKPAFWLIQLIFYCFCFYWVISICTWQCVITFAWFIASFDKRTHIEYITSFFFYKVHPYK